MPLRPRPCPWILFLVLIAGAAIAPAAQADSPPAPPEGQGSGATVMSTDAATSAAPASRKVVARATARKQGGFAHGWLDATDADTSTGLRWGTLPRSIARFNKGAPKGRYTLHLSGYREPYPQAATALVARFQGDPDDRPYSVAVGPGQFDVSLPVRLRHDHDSRLLLELRCVGWRPCDVGKGSGREWRTFAFSEAWLEVRQRREPK